MDISVNGERAEVEAGTSVAQLVARYNYKPEHVAVEVNEDLVTRKNHADTVLAEGDKVEIVTLVGGG